MVSKLEDLKNIGVQEVALSGFAPGEPFIVIVMDLYNRRLHLENRLGFIILLLGEAPAGQKQSFSITM